MHWTDYRSSMVHRLVIRYPLWDHMYLQYRIIRQEELHRLHTRGVVAMAGTFGYELNLGKLSEEEKEEVRSQVEEYRKFAPLIQTGLYYRLSDPSKEESGMGIRIRRSERSTAECSDAGDSWKYDCELCKPSGIEMQCGLS